MNIRLVVPDSVPADNHAELVEAPESSEYLPDHRSPLVGPLRCLVHPAPEVDPHLVDRILLQHWSRNHCWYVDALESLR
jgi:hypothetical protein